jgi:hypothetical protein
MTRGRHTLEEGAISKLLLSTIILGLIAVIGVILSVLFFLDYNQQKTNVDTRISAAVATAQKTQSDSDEAKFLLRDQEPYRQFVGPDDYGRLTFDYPKTWSVYVYKDVVNAGDTYQAYLNPVSVPPISSSDNTTQIYALVVTITTTDFATVLDSYNSLVKSGALQSSTVTIGGTAATRLDGAFSANITGSVVIFKIRDEVVTIQTDATTFGPEFNSIVSSIKFNS